MTSEDAPTDTIVVLAGHPAQEMFSPTFTLVIGETEPTAVELLVRVPVGVAGPLLIGYSTETLAIQSFGQ